MRLAAACRLRTAWAMSQGQHGRRGVRDSGAGGGGKGIVEQGDCSAAQREHLHSDDSPQEHRAQDGHQERGWPNGVCPAQQPHRRGHRDLTALINQTT